MRQAIDPGVPRGDPPARLMGPAGPAKPTGYVRPAAATQPTSTARTGTALRAEVGDTLIVESEGAAGLPRIGEILAVAGPDGSPPYRVRWLAGEYESLIRPGRSARVQKGH